MTRTFRNTSPIVMGDEEPASPYPSTVTVAGLKRGKLLDLNVTLVDFTHDYPRDADLLLVAPNGLSAVIMSDVGGSTEIANLSVVIDDQASAAFSFDSLVSGRFQPRNATDPALTDYFPAPASYSPNVALATFNGINPNGTWRLYVVDDIGDFTGETGSIAGGWTLTIKARVRV